MQLVFDSMGLSESRQKSSSVLPVKDNNGETNTNNRTNSGETVSFSLSSPPLQRNGNGPVQRGLSTESLSPRSDTEMDVRDTAPLTRPNTQKTATRGHAGHNGGFQGGISSGNSAMMGLLGPALTLYPQVDGVSRMCFFICVYPDASGVCMWSDNVKHILASRVINMANI